MKRFSFFIFCFSLLLLIATACQNNRVSDTLQSADRLMFESPDSAVAALDIIDLTRASRAERARHALLLTKAREKADIVITDDSLISVATDYYNGRGDSLEVQSLFYRGVILSHRNDYPQALLSLIQAADLADALGDDFYLAMAYREQAAVYANLYSFKQAARYRQLAIDGFNKCGRPIYAAWERVYLPQDLIYSDKIEEAYDSVMILASDSLIQTDKFLREDFLFIACNVCFQNHKFEQAEKYFDSLIKEGGTPSSRLYSQLAQLYILKQDIPNARLCYDRAVATQENEDDILAASSALASIYEAEGQLNKAHELNISIQNKIAKLYNPLISNPYSAQLADHLHSKVRSQSQLLSNSYFRLAITLSLSLALVLTIVLLVLHHRRKIQQKEIQLKTVLEDLSHLNNQIKSYASNSTAINLLNSICETRNAMLSGEEGQRRFAKTVSDTIVSLSSEHCIAEIEEYVNRTKANLMAKFRQQTVGMSDKQLKFVALTFFGFSQASISAIMQYTSANSTRSMRLRIRQNIKGHPTVDSDLFLSFF